MGKQKQQNPDIDEIIKRAVDAGRLAAERQPKDAYKATERRLYALPVLREKLADDLERLQELQSFGPRERSKSIVRFQKSGVNLSKDEIFEALVLDLQAEIERDEFEIDTMESALATIEGDDYYKTVTGRYIDGLADEDIAASIPCDTTTVWRNRKRLIRRLSVRLYGATAV